MVTAKAPKRSKPTVGSPSVGVRDWVLVRMPHEEGKAADRYFVVEVDAVAMVNEGRILEEGSSLAYARKRVAIEVARDAEARQRNPKVVGA